MRCLDRSLGRLKGGLSSWNGPARAAVAVSRRFGTGEPDRLATEDVIGKGARRLCTIQRRGDNTHTREPGCSGE